MFRLRLFLRAKEVVYKSELAWATGDQSCGTLPGFAGLFLRLGPMGEAPMDEITKTEVWDLAAGMFIVISMVSGLAFIIASAIH